MSEFSIERAMGFSTTKSTPKVAKDDHLFLINDDRVKLLAESVENADTINTYQMLQERCLEEKRRMIAKLNRFSENHLANHKTEKHSVECYLNNCLLSMERDEAPLSGPGVVNALTRGGQIGKLVSHFPSFVATAIKGCTSCGDFDKAEDILKSQKLLEKVDKFKASKGDENMATIQELKKGASKVRTKAGFVGWLLNGDTSGTKISKLNPSATIIKDVKGVTCVVVKLNPFMSTNDFKVQYKGYDLLIVTAIYKNKSGKLKSKNIARGYLMNQRMNGSNIHMDPKTKTSAKNSKNQKKSSRKS